MATSFLEVYKANNLIKNDPRLKNLDGCELNTIRFGYLKFAISYFMYDCRKDLSDKTDPETNIYMFECDGKEDEFILEPAPPVGSEYVCWYIEDEEKMDMTPSSSFDGTTVKLDFVPEAGSGLIVKAYTYGEFNVDLDVREINILAEGMNVPYISESKNDENAMKYIVTGKSLRFFSQANHITAQNENWENQKYHMVDSLISEYSYKGSEDNYMGLSGRGGG